MKENEMPAAHVTKHDRELILQLFEDVAILDQCLMGGIPKPSEARTVIVPILRRWIAEGLFFVAQKHFKPREALFSINSNQHAVKLCRAGVFEHWMGPVIFGAMGVSIAQTAQKYLGPEYQAQRQVRDVAMPSLQKPSQFIDQKMFFWKGEFYQRKDVIIMHANKLGGVHLDFRRKQDETHINEIKNYFGFEIIGNNHHMLVGDQIDQGRSDPARRQQIYDATELIAIDTGRIFADGINNSKEMFLEGLE